MGYLLKDYNVFYKAGLGLEIGLIIHHFCTIIAICLHFKFPMAAGVGALQCCQCEFGSSVYSFSGMFPSAKTKGFYFIIMFFSNWFAAYITYQFYFFDVPTHLKMIYITLSILVGIIRWAGFGIEINSIKINGCPRKNKSD